MSKHTPGPWTVSTDSWVENHVDIDAENHGALAVVVWKMEEEERSPECEANARLIAAAPDLLEALKKFVADCEFVNAEYSDLREAEELARAAIAKAEDDQ